MTPPYSGVATMQQPETRASVTINSVASDCSTATARNASIVANLSTIVTA